MCSIESGTPPFQFEWIKDGMRFKEDERITLVVTEDISTLIIKKTKPADAGNYTCIAKNAYGTDAHTTGLIVMGELS